ncbi:MAG: hypothetical protein ACR2NF_09365 [Pirellulales bacterium]
MRHYPSVDENPMTGTKCSISKEPKRSPFSISLNWFLVAVLVTGFLFGWVGKIIDKVRHQRNTVAELALLDCEVSYEKSRE